MGEDQLKQLQELREEKKRKKRNILIGCGIAALIAVFIAVVCIIELGGDFATPKKTVTAFYNSLYVDSDLETMKKCVVEELRNEMDTVFTLAGINEEYIATYKAYAQNYLGGEYTLELQFKKERNMASGTLNSMRQTYEDVSAGKYVDTVVCFYAGQFNGGFNISIELVKQDGDWRMTSYKLIPLGDIPSFS